MRNDDLDAKGKDVGGSAAANGAAAVGRKRKKRRSWSAEKKIRIARESFSTQESVTAVARRYGIARKSAWRSLLRRGKLVAPSSVKAEPAGAFADVEVEERPSVVIEGRGVTIRLTGSPTRAGSRRSPWRWRGRPLGGTRIVVATQPVDFRKGHDGLAAVVHNELGLDPYSGVAYVFRAKRADRIKVLWWDGTGLVLAYKRLEQGRFAWPTVGSPGRSSRRVRALDWRRRGARGCGARARRPDAEGALQRPRTGPFPGRVFVYNSLIL